MADLGQRLDFLGDAGRETPTFTHLVYTSTSTSKGVMRGWSSLLSTSNAVIQPTPIQPTPIQPTPPHTRQGHDQGKMGSRQQSGARKEKTENAGVKKPLVSGVCVCMGGAVYRHASRHTYINA